MFNPVANRGPLSSSFIPSGSGSSPIMDHVCEPGVTVPLSLSLNRHNLRLLGAVVIVRQVKELIVWRNDESIWTIDFVTDDPADFAILIDAQTSSSASARSHFPCQTDHHTGDL